MAERNSATIELDEASKKLLKILKKGESLTVEEVVSRAMRRFNFKRHEAARALYKLREKGLVVFIDPHPPTRFDKYLFSSRATWFWLLALAVILTDLTIYILSSFPVFKYVRYILGSLFVLYLPGAALIELLYPKREDLSQLERLALSLGLSLALVPLVGLILNYTPWGIRLDPIVISLTFLTLALALGAVYRKYTYHLLAHRGALSGG